MDDLEIYALRADQLTPDHIEQWSALQRGNSAFDHPFFHPEFTRAVAAVRDDVEVGIIERDGRYVGFFPFHREANDVGQPVGGTMSDMNGVIVAGDVEWTAMDLLQGCGLAAWYFDHLITTQAPFEPYYRTTEDSPYMDLSAGYDAYVKQRRDASGGSSIRQAERKARKIAREVGPLTFHLHTDRRDAFDTLVAWKREQIVRMQYVDVFSSDWVVNMLRRVSETNVNGFQGLLSALYAGDRMVAVHLGVRSGAVISSWIPAYDPAFGRYSPGVLLHLELARIAADQGVERIDLGRGENRMKTNLMSGAYPVALGFVDRRPINRLVSHGWYRLRDLVYSTPLQGPPLRLYRRARNLLSGLR